MKPIKPTSAKKGREASVSDSLRTLLQVELWTDTPPSDVSSARSGEINVLPSALAMVGDMLTAAGGEFRTSSSTSMSAWFGDTLQAVSAARRLQRLVRGFSRASINGPLYVCFTLTSGSEPEIEDDANLRASIDTLRQNQSEEVLFIGSICDAAQTIPGLQFKTPSSDLIAANGDTPRQTILQLLPPIHMEGFVDEPLTVSAPAPLPPHPRAAEPTLHWEASTPARQSPFSATNSFDASAQLPGSLKINPRWAIIGVSSVVVLASALIFIPLFKSSPRPAQPQPQPPSGTEKTVVPPPVPAPVNPAPVPAPQPETAAKPTPPPAKPADLTHAHAAKESTLEEPKPPRGNRAVTFDPAEIQLLIDSADRDTGNGNYDKAIREYTTVLNQDPSNALAKKGLAKALRNKGHN
jgi:hypothetical protein